MNNGPKPATLLLGVLAVLLVAAGGVPLAHALCARLPLPSYLPVRTADLTLLVAGATLGSAALRRAGSGR
ncbi:hypothetical protein ABZZ17_38975 [Streptomyces sp. NPDC006512]|uniref:hypothetical protein n=1 Tax=Streptomyces sp. NPDC006512 TaxID=3154307 RepID=UPI0033AFA547